MIRNKRNRLLRFGLAGAAIVALFHFTPLLATILDFIEQSAWTYKIEPFVLPVLYLFLGIAALGLLRGSRS